jgi:AcrR family transcriptional regulator
VTVERWTPERRRELTRGALIAAAAQVFARRGFDGASLEEIADAAGYTRGAIYKNFGSKEELFLAVSERDFAMRLQSFSERLDLRPDEALDSGALTGMWRETITGDAENLALNMEVRLYALRNPDFAARFAEHQRASRRALADFIVDQAEKAGFTVDIDPMTLAGMLDAASWGLAESIAIDPDDENLLAAFFELIVTSACSEPAAPSAKRAAPTTSAR